MIGTADQRYPKPGDRVRVIQKRDYGTGRLTVGVVQDVLTKKRHHSRGHKVRLASGVIGRVQEFVDATEETLPAPGLVDFDPEVDLR